jgi:hypothetical protein
VSETMIVASVTHPSEKCVWFSYNRELVKTALRNQYLKTRENNGVLAHRITVFVG